MGSASWGLVLTLVAQKIAANAMDEASQSFDYVIDDSSDVIIGRAANNLPLGHNDFDEAVLGKQAAAPAASAVQPEASKCRLAPLNAISRPVPTFNSSITRLRAPHGRRTDIIGVPAGPVGSLSASAGRLGLGSPGRGAYYTGARLVLAQHAAQAEQHAKWAVAGTDERWLRSGGGHAVVAMASAPVAGPSELGYHLALYLQAQGLKVTLLQASESKAKNAKPQQPYRFYDERLPETRFVLVDPTDDDSYTEMAAAAVKDMMPVTHIFDNLSREPRDIAALLALANASPDFKLYSWISSSKAGAEADVVSMEVKLRQEFADGNRWASFRPQYIDVNPDMDRQQGYLDWFLERTVGNIPRVGSDHMPMQSESLAHCEEVAALLSSVVGKEEAAGGEIFNCGTSDLVTGNRRAVCEAAGKPGSKDVNIVPPVTAVTMAETFAVNVHTIKDNVADITHDFSDLGLRVAKVAM